MLCLRSSGAFTRSISLLPKRRLTPTRLSTRCASSPSEHPPPNQPYPNWTRQLTIYPSRTFIVLSSHRPRILSQSLPIPTTSPPFPLPPSSSSIDLIAPAPDLLPKISLHPALANIQVRNGPRDTFNPSHRVRKRRHGFLSRLRSRTGRMTLKRRKLKRRSTLSH